eukprot:TRINITY_DN9206_c0_g1_i1.p1 TRINITY_DN9206_c0_g1~~TRINITY_DN9206_c0_g1_i1.p1  ORF type:complete len:963 (-),score=235.68 TRINITY_DN9206_c0_g1_i1:123-3011(-)
MNSLPSAEPIWVGMRLRPLVNREKGEKPCLTISDNVVSIEMDDTHEPCKKFAFDVAMDSTDPSSPSHVSQAKCYEIMGKRMLKQMLQGYNTCLFCYGQTGTGKTTTIMGKAHPPEDQGLLMRLITDIFEEVRKQKASGSEVHLVVQMLEVYNERLNDLLATPSMSYNGQKKKIDVRVHPELGVYLTGVEESLVQSAAECLQLIEYGNTMKAVSSTAMNASSSRGHTVFKLSMEKKGGSDNLTTSSEVCFADLAGRENERTTQVTGERLVELSFINRSLMWLATCIQSLGGMGSGEGSGRGRRKTIAGLTPTSGERKDMSRFRNSKLTLLLSNALSGNSRTAMIGTLSPAAANFEESFSTLRFASTVKSIKLEAKAATAIDKDSLVRKLEDEVKALRAQLEKAREKQDVEDISDIRSKIEATTAIAAVQARDWGKFLKEAADISKRRSQTLERLTSFASSYMGSHALPYLANYSEDPHLAFKLVLHVPPDGEDRTIGSGQGNHFRLPPSLGICHLTAFVRNDEGRLFVRAASIPQSSSLGRRPASVEVNAKRLENDEIELKHLDCILFGRSTVFYVFMQPTAPEELAKVVSTRSFEEDEGFHEASSMQMQELAALIIGEDRSADPLESQLAKEYCNQLQSQHLDSEGNAALRAFMLTARRAKLKVDEANEITETVRTGEGLSFELVTVAPVLSYGYPGTGNLPDLSVRLVRHLSASRMRWKFVASQRRSRTIEGAVRYSLSIPPEKPGSAVEMLTTWSWAKFISRLDLMQEVREAWLADPDNFMLDPMKDPWKEHGPSELEELCQEHDHQVQELREKWRLREKELEEHSGGAELQKLREELELSKKTELATADELQKLRKELEAMKAQSKTLIVSDEMVPATSSAATPKADACSRCGNVLMNDAMYCRKCGQSRALTNAFRNGSVTAMLQEADAKDRVSRCLELSRANKALLESLSSEQIYGQ